MLFYLQSLVLLVARRAVGDTLENRTPTSLPFSTVERGARGAGVGDLVDSMIEGRVVLEKTKVLESRIRYQIEKLVRIADADDASKNVANGESYSFVLVRSPLTALSFTVRPLGLPTQPSKPGQQRPSLGRGRQRRGRQPQWHLQASQTGANALHRKGWR